MPPKGRGRGRGGRGGGVGSTHPPSARPGTVCKPQATQIPKTLIPMPLREPVPAPVVEALTEFRGLQTYFSALERLQPEVASHEQMGACWFGIPGTSMRALRRSTEEDKAGFFGTLETTDGQEHPVFIKRIHILDPMAVLEGESIAPLDGGLPVPADLWLNTLDKITDPMNEAYVDAVFARVADAMVANTLSPHWLRCYGSCVGRVDSYQYNITEEYPSLRAKHFWKRNLELGLFELVVEDVDDGDTRRSGGGPAGIVFSEGVAMDVEGVEVLSDEEEVPNTASTATAAAATIATEDDFVEIGGSTQSDKQASHECFAITEPRVRIRKLSPTSSASSSSSEASDTTGETDYRDYYAEFTDFPVQMTLLERAEGTLDELLDAEEDATAVDPVEKEHRWRAWMFQVIAALAAAQHWFGFVHNDLHTNNVMWTRTDAPYLYYRITSGPKKTEHLYRVPTHGYILKIIDFGRASYWLPEPAGFFISDAFYPGNDASHQYNCEPFFDARNGKKVEPNPSFDLSRLAVSMLESLWPTRPDTATPIKVMSREGNKTYPETVSALYNMMWEWLTDDAGKNILREPNGTERYPDFDLYPAIATDVHRAIPSKQLLKPLFAEAFTVTTVPTDAQVYSLWA